MPCRVLLGGQWGDEGKGKVVDYLSAEADAVVRFQGGANAGHTLIRDDERLAVHLIPSGVLHPSAELILANGMVIDPLALLEEIAGLEAGGLAVSSRLSISLGAHLVLPYHKLQDALEEEDRGDQGIGTTRRGIGPAYADKAARTGIQMGIFLQPVHEAKFLLKMAAEKKLKNLRAISADAHFDIEEMVDRVLECGSKLRPLLMDTTTHIHELLGKGAQVLLEGAQGVLLDLDHGSYPYVTSSACTVGGAIVGSGLSPRDLDGVTGIFKAYATRVGQGPFPSELDDEDGDRLRDVGKEFGTTTGRPRRCGWFDAVAARHAVRLSGFDELVITKLDVLDDFERIRVATAYDYNGQRSVEFPGDARVLSECTPSYVSLPGWQAPTTGCRSQADLPAAARRYLEALHEYVGVPIRYVSVGPARESMFEMQA